MGKHQENELEGRISYAFLRDLTSSQTKEFHIRKTQDNRFILRIGDIDRVERGEGINYLHFHPQGCGIKRIDGEVIRQEFEGLPSLNDVNIMLQESAPHMVVSEYGIATYIPKEHSQKDHNEVARKFRFPNLDSLETYELMNYDIFRSRVGNSPMIIKMPNSKIEYLPWKQSFLQKHDFRKVPDLNVNGFGKFISESLLDNVCVSR